MLLKKSRRDCVRNLENLAAQISETGPANCDICLGVRTVRVLSIAKEVAALPADRSHWPQSAQTQAGQIGLTDQRLSAKKLLSFFCLLMHTSLLEVIIGRELPIECSKLACSAKVKKSAWFPSSDIDDQS